MSNDLDSDQARRSIQQMENYPPAGKELVIYCYKTSRNEMLALLLRLNENTTSM